MARNTTPRKNSTRKTVATLTHEEARRKNIPTAEYQSVMQKEAQSPVRVAYERRNRDLDTQLVWRGKDEQDWSDLVVQAPPLYIQEKVHPKVLIDDLLKQTRQRREQDVGAQPDLFADFNGIPEGVDRTEFYQHDQNWSNLMILGDSLQVMASLAEREGLRGKVQCIYLDSPYGIKFNSNFQWSTTSRDVKDGNTDHITREPEQVKAFRDTWRDGIHSYLTYLRDRLTVVRDLLADSGSIFVQIGDENVHRVRALMDEVFGENNCISQIGFAKTSGSTDDYLGQTTDYLLWYSRDIQRVKFRASYKRKRPGESGGTNYNRIRNIMGQSQPLNDSLLSDSRTKAGDLRIYSLNLSPYELVNPDMNHRHGEKRVEACRKTFPADDQTAVLALEPGKCPFGLEARNILVDRPPTRLSGLPHPFGDLRADPPSTEALAQVFGVIAVVRRQHLESFARSAAFTRAEAEGIQQGEDLGALVPIGRRRAQGQWHASGVREAVDEHTFAFAAIRNTLTTAFARGNTSHPRPRTATESCRVLRQSRGFGRAWRRVCRPPASAATSDAQRSSRPIGGHGEDHTSGSR
jgi:DNA methylase